MAILEWGILAIGVVGTIVIIALPIKPNAKISVLLPFLAVIVAAYTLTVQMQIKERETESTNISRGEAYWSNIHLIFMNNTELEPLYKSIHGNVDTKNFAALSIISQAIENLINTHLEIAPHTIIGNDIHDHDWLYRVYRWSNSIPFKQFWPTNYQYYDRHTDAVVRRMWELEGTIGNRV